ncbi:MAG: helix-turn-helix domain-containing protein, partial [Longimicrobiales bacterium]
LYRLNTVEIQLPPLRDRPEDVAALSVHFLKRERGRYGKKLSGLDREALQAMVEHTWPGNIRELEHTIERAVLMAVGPQIRVDDLGLRARGDGAARFEEMTLEEAEKHLIQKALARHQGNVSRAAEALGLSRSALYRRLQHFGLSTG